MAIPTWTRALGLILLLAETCMGGTPPPGDLQTVTAQSKAPGAADPGLPGRVPESRGQLPSRPTGRNELVFGALRFYRSAQHDRAGYEQLIQGMRSRGVALYPRVVLGSYLDLVDWITRGRIDLAWLPPLSYISASRTQPGIQPLATVLRRDHSGRLTASTTSLLVTRKGELPGDLKKLAGKRVVFGAELSTSGFLLPLHFLSLNGVHVPQPYQYAGSQQQAVDLLLGGADHGAGADVIGVSELTVNELPPATLARLDLVPASDAEGTPIRIPNDAIVGRAGLPAGTASRLREVLLSLGQGRPGLPADFSRSKLGVVGFSPFDMASYEQLKRILETGILRSDRYPVLQALDSIRWDVELERDLARLEGRPYKPRIALVLSGGGAAGAFQAGAVMEVCRAMRELSMKPDIVVGTSVGAINGSAVAMGRSEDLDRFWAAATLDGVMTVRPDDMPLGLWKVWLIRVAQRAPAALALTVFLILAYLEVLLFVWALHPLNLSAKAGVSLIALAGAAVWATAGTWHGPTLITLASLTAAHGLVVHGRRQPGGGRLKVGLQRSHAVVLVLLLLLIPAQLHHAIGDREALFSTDGLHRLLGRFFLDLRGKPIPGTDHDLAAAVADSSRDLVKEGLPCTLVISTTDYHRQIARNFYVTDDPEVERRAREHGYTSIRDSCPGQFLDVVVASAAVFPVLEPCTLTLAGGEVVRLIDGGFVHNNPVQVAVDMGATHVLIIKPSADQEFVAGDRSLLSSLVTFFGWLIARSQTEDLRAKDEVMSFLIGPTGQQGAEVIGPLEFDGHYSGDWGLESGPSLTLQGFLDAGRLAARSSDRGFQLWSRGTFKLPPIQ